jgi:hypothetical protein
MLRRSTIGLATAAAIGSAVARKKALFFSVAFGPAVVFLQPAFAADPSECDLSAMYHAIGARSSVFGRSLAALAIQPDPSVFPADRAVVA